MSDVSSNQAFHPLRMGLTPVAFEDWLKPKAGDADICRERAILVADKAAEVLAVLPQAHEAVAELAILLKDRGFSGIPSGGDIVAMAAIGEVIAEDICILTPDGGYRLTAAVLCFPNRWRLRDKIGHTLLDIHGPVPDYPEALATQVDRFLERLRPLRPFTRENWGLASRPERHLPDPIPPVDPASDRDFYARSEEQGFLKLPASKAIVFTIRTTVVPWTQVSQEQKAGIAAVLPTLSPAWLTYKSIRRG